MQPTTTPSSPLRTALRVLIGIVVIIILIFLSIWIVRAIPRFIGYIAGSGNATSTNPMATSTMATSTYNNGGGFIIIDNNASSTCGYNPNNCPSNQPMGTPDLAATIISRGIINPANGAYIETSNIKSTDTVVVKFKIENRGTAPSGIWNLTVSMPTNNSSDKLRQVNGNRSIAPGISITGKAVFSNAIVGSNMPVIITADPSALIPDSNRTNNVASVGFNVSAGYPYHDGGNGGNTSYGHPDFTVQISQVGILDQYNRFIPTTNIPANGRVAVQFKVTNIGNNSGPCTPWSFRAEMTDYPNVNKIFNSDPQPGLIGGQSVTYTIGFDSVTRGQNTISLFIDSQNNILETNENNNFGSVGFNVY